jgi:hypothetical protein
MQPVNATRLNEILIELEQLGDELEDIQGEQTDTTIEYELSECGSSLSDARVTLRQALSHIE